MVETIRRRSNEVTAALAQEILNWMHGRSPRVMFTDSPTFGSAYFAVQAGAAPCVPIRLGTEPGLTLNLNQLARTEAFASREAREAVVAKFAAICDADVSQAALDGQLYVRLTTVHDGKGLIELLDEVVGALDAPHPSATAL